MATLHKFEFSGGRLCLDFANTARYDLPPREDLPTFHALVAWGEGAGVVGASDARRLRSEAGRRPGEAASTLAAAHALRLAIYRTFSAAAAGTVPAAEDLATINHAAVEASAHFRIVPQDRGFGWELAAEPRAPSLERIVWLVARSAAELLTSGELATVRECALPTCAWLFLDRSRNHKRRWCDMKVCGNRSKARRHYEKTRQASS